MYSTHRGVQRKGETSKCDAYDIKDSSRRPVVPKPWNLWEKNRNLQVLVQTPEPPGKTQNLWTPRQELS
jgi:hypothetical protein